MKGKAYANRKKKEDRPKGDFNVGAMQTAWFLWDLNHTGPWTGKVLDVQKYAKLGAFKK